MSQYKKKPSKESIVDSTPDLFDGALRSMIRMFAQYDSTKSLLSVTGKIHKIWTSYSGAVDLEVSLDELHKLCGSPGHQLYSNGDEVTFAPDGLMDLAETKSSDVTFKFPWRESTVNPECAIVRIKLRGLDMTQALKMVSTNDPSKPVEGLMVTVMFDTYVYQDYPNEKTIGISFRCSAPFYPVNMIHSS